MRFGSDNPLIRNDLKKYTTLRKRVAQPKTDKDPKLVTLNTVQTIVSVIAIGLSIVAPAFGVAINITELIVTQALSLAATKKFNWTSFAIDLVGVALGVRSNFKQLTKINKALGNVDEIVDVLKKQTATDDLFKQIKKNYPGNNLDKLWEKQHKDWLLSQTERNLVTGIEINPKHYRAAGVNFKNNLGKNFKNLNTLKSSNLQLDNSKNFLRNRGIRESNLRSSISDTFMSGEPRLGKGFDFDYWSNLQQPRRKAFKGNVGGFERQNRITKNYIRKNNLNKSIKRIRKFEAKFDVPYSTRFNKTFLSGQGTSTSLSASVYSKKSQYNFLGHTITSKEKKYFLNVNKHLNKNILKGKRIKEVDTLHANLPFTYKGTNAVLTKLKKQQNEKLWDFYNEVKRYKGDGFSPQDTSNILKSIRGKKNIGQDPDFYRYKDLNYQTFSDIKTGYVDNLAGVAKKASNKKLMEAMKEITDFIFDDSSTTKFIKGMTEAYIDKATRKAVKYIINPAIEEAAFFRKFFTGNLENITRTKAQVQFATLSKMIRSKEMRAFWKLTGISPNEIMRRSFREGIVKRVAKLEKAVETLKAVPGFKKYSFDKFYEQISNRVADKNNARFIEMFFRPKKHIKSYIQAGIRKTLFPNHLIKKEPGWWTKKLTNNDRDVILATNNRLLYQPNRPRDVEFLLDNLKKNTTPEGFAWYFNRIAKNKKGIIPLDDIKKYSKFHQSIPVARKRADVLWSRMGKILNWDNAHFFGKTKLYSSAWVKRFKKASSDEWNDIVQGTSSLFNSQDAGRNIIEYGSGRAKRLIEKRIIKNSLRKSLKNAIKKGTKVLRKTSELRDAFIASGGHFIYSSYLLGFKIIDSNFHKNVPGGTLVQSKRLCIMHFRPDATSTISKSAKNYGGKPPVMFWATTRELNKIKTIGGTYWFDWSNRNKGWWKNRGGRIGSLQFPSLKEASFFLNFIPINAWRRSASLFSNAINAFGDPKDSTAIWNIGKKEYWEGFVDSFTRTATSRISRLILRYGLGNLYKKSLYKKIIRKAALKGAAAKTVNQAWNIANRKAYFANKALLKFSSSLTTSLKLRFKKGKFKSTLGKSYGSYFGQNVVKGIATTGRSGLKRASGGYENTYNVAYSNQIKLGQVRRVWSVFTPNSWAGASIRRWGTIKF